MICPITELASESNTRYTHSIKINNELLVITLGLSFENVMSQEKFTTNRYILAGAILNKQLSDENEKGPYHLHLTSDNFEEKLNSIIYPKTPKSKLDNLLKSLYVLQKFDGELVDIIDITTKPEFYYKHFFKSAEECTYYIKELDYQGLINSQFQEHPDLPLDFQITFKGLNYYLELTERGDLSRKCFVAMSFDPKMKETREAIKQAILKNNFEPIIIDEQLIDSSQTINDAIISAIKSCKFCIADFSEQKDGVYFESGFAIGLNKPVVYTCHKDWFSKSHFDTNHFPHIIYASLMELTEKLDLKIKAWIK